MQTCGSCRFWEFGQEVAQPLSTATSARQGACRRFGASLADAQPKIAVDPDGFETTRAYIGLDPDYRGGALFMTQDDFGCVQHETTDG